MRLGPKLAGPKTSWAWQLPIEIGEGRSRRMLAAMAVDPNNRAAEAGRGERLGRLRRMGIPFFAVGGERGSPSLALHGGGWSAGGDAGEGSEERLLASTRGVDEVLQGAVALGEVEARPEVDQSGPSWCFMWWTALRLEVRTTWW